MRKLSAAALDRRIKKLTSALLFYASPDTYFAVGMFPNSPCGPIMKDFGDTYLGKKPGALARRALGKSWERFFMKNDIEFPQKFYERLEWR